MRLLHFFAALTLLLGSSLAHAATLNFNGGTVSGCSLSTDGLQYTCASLAPGSTDVIVIGSAYGVTVNSSLAMSYNQGLTMSGNAALTVKGNLDIKDINPSNLKVTGGSLSAEGGTFLMGAQEQTITANISATTIKMGSNNVKVTGKISAKGPVEIASGSVINGPISGTVVNILASSTRIQGDITATTSLTIGSGSQVTGNLKSPTIDLKASGLLVTGDVDASNSLSIASGNGIKGNVDAGEVTLDSSNAYITGNAKVDHITLGWQGRVQQTITCKAYTPSNPCSCVTNNSGWAFNEPMGPKCGPGTQAGPDHFQITHPPSALSCAPAPVTVTACADAACSTVYTGAAQVTLTPGGAVAQLNATLPATGTAASSVAQTTPASNVPLGLSSTPATTGALVCKSSIDGSVTNCQMAFVSSALQVSGLPRYAEAEGPIAISALQASASNPRACVPLFSNQNKTLQLRCNYANPGTGTLPARIQDKDGTYKPLAANAGSACSANGTAVQLAFDANGLATPNMLYADAGALGLTATYAPASGSDSGLTMTGSGTVIVGPRRFVFSAIATPQRAGLAALPVEPATRISVSAVNVADAVTANFGRETTAQTVLLGSSLVAPTFSGAANPAVAGSLTFNNGIGTASNLSWAEAGTVQFTATMATYLGAPPPAVNGVVPPFATGASNSVQFIPHHFVTEVPGTEPMPCKAPLSCAAGSFIYAQQPFKLRVTAQNATNGTTLNFDGRDTALTTQVALRAYDAATGLTAFPPAAPSGSRLSDGTAAQTSVTGIAPASFTAGVASSQIAYRFPGAFAVPAGTVALAPPTDVLFRATTTYAGGTAVTSAPSDAGTEAKLTVLTGRIMVPHSYGSERLPIRLPVQVQYWNSGWLGNVSDSVTQFGSAGVTLANCGKGFTSGTGACNGVLKVQGGTYAFKQGALPPPNGQLVLLAPGVAGSVDVSVSGLHYLPSTLGHVVFGILRSGPVIYLREMY
ncbi:polymer-forming cytoskeletal protein [Janthinobacterium sp. FW305-128]|uniref:DUF6701 domain-containing protein n=1 Tax=Janthinobacterium sp. FW305-128 TaxID=2775055 RepID=UPI001E52F6DC|nr:polymer-forming cytoskeletal protein [Janthinobacterium sp. FW305-128]